MPLHRRTGGALILPFPAGEWTGDRCRTCGFPFPDDSTEEECYCCRQTPTLFAETCTHCGGRGVVEMPVLRNDREYTPVGTKTEPCMACLGSKRR